MKDIRTITIDSLSKEKPAVVALNGRLTLHDNFDRPIPWEHIDLDAVIDIPTRLDSIVLLFFCLKGQLTMERDGREFTLTENRVAFISSGLFSRVHHISRDLSFALIAMGEEFYSPILSRFVNAALQKELIVNPVCTFSSNRMDECIALYRLLKQRLLSCSADAMNDEIVRGYLHTLTFNAYSQFYMSRSIDTSSKLHPNRHKELYNSFMELLHIHYATERKIDFYADRLCITPRYLSRVISEVSGSFASDYINYFVISEAKQLLRSKRYSMQEVSDLLHFTCQSAFSRFFKKYTGYTPKEYHNL